MQENKKYTLDELVGSCDPSRPPSTEEQAWLEAAPAGQEVGSGQDDESTKSRKLVRKQRD